MNLLKNKATRNVLRCSPNGKYLEETWGDGNPVKSLPVSVKWSYVPDSAYSDEAHLYGWVNIKSAAMIRFESP